MNKRIIQISVILSVAVCMLAAVKVSAQEIVTREDGSKIIIYENRTWKPYVEEKPAEVMEEAELTCEKLIDEFQDIKTGKIVKATKNPIVVTGRRKMSFMITFKNFGNGEALLNARIIGARTCMAKGTTMRVVFDDKSRLDLKLDNEFNCDGDATVLFGGKHGREDALKQLAGKKISSLRIPTATGSLKEKLKEMESEKLYKALNCLAE